MGGVEREESVILESIDVPRHIPTYARRVSAGPRAVFVRAKKPRGSLNRFASVRFASVHTRSLSHSLSLSLSLSPYCVRCSLSRTRHRRVVMVSGVDGRSASRRIRSTRGMFFPKKFRRYEQRTRVKRFRFPLPYHHHYHHHGRFTFSNSYYPPAPVVHFPDPPTLGYVTAGRFSNEFFFAPILPPPHTHPSDPSVRPRINISRSAAAVHGRGFS